MSFRLFIEEAIATAWLRSHDILICDNATIHQQGYNGDLGDFLWNSPGLDGAPHFVVAFANLISRAKYNQVGMEYYGSKGKVWWEEGRRSACCGADSRKRFKHDGFQTYAPHISPLWISLLT